MGSENRAEEVDEVALPWALNPRERSDQGLRAHGGRAPGGDKKE